MNISKTLMMRRYPMLLKLCLWSLAIASTTLHAQDNATPASQQAVIEIIRLQHKDPEIVREALAPHLDERGNISQIDRNLIISTSRANLTDLEAIIEEIDVPPRQLLIRVNFNYGEPPAQSSDDGSQFDRISTARVETPIQSLMVSEGEYAYFNRYQDTPRVSPVFGPYGMQLQQDQQRSEQSIAVTAQLRGDQVLLEFAASELESANGSNLAQGQSLRSTALISLNRWVSLQQVLSESEILSANGPSFTATTNLEGALAVRIELIPN